MVLRTLPTARQVCILQMDRGGMVFSTIRIQYSSCDVRVAGLTVARVLSGAVGVNVSNLNASNITVNGTYAPTSSPTPAPTGSPTNVPYSNNERLAWPSTASL